MRSHFYIEPYSTIEASRGVASLNTLDEDVTLAPSAMLQEGNTNS